MGIRFDKQLTFEIRDSLVLYEKDANSSNHTFEVLILE